MNSAEFLLVDLNNLVDQIKNLGLDEDKLLITMSEYDNRALATKLGLLELREYRGIPIAIAWNRSGEFEFYHTALV
jgi:hypothetical protein